MKQTTKPEQAKHRSKIGGQALIEGVMMKGVHTGAMACRLPDGTIDVETWEEHNGKEMPWYRKCPFVRGSFNFVISMRDGYRCLMKSAEKQMTEEEKENEPQEEMNRFERWLNDKLGDKVFGIIMSISMVIGVAFAVFAFIFLPKFLIGLLIAHTPIPDNSRFVRSLLEGVLKIIIFLGYMAFTGCMKDIRRTYEYHGAEHKTIACFEAGDPLTVENVKKHCRFHPRCGTSFMILVIIISIFLYAVLPWTSTGLRVVYKLCMFPLLVGVSYEILKWAGRSDSALSHIVSQPGLWMQRLTTFEPDDSMIEVAIAAVTPVLPENQEEARW